MDMSMPSMSMTFFVSTSTPLFSAAWNPHSTGAYAGTCIFLIFLSAFFRALFAVKAVLEHRWLDTALNRRYVVVTGKKNEGQRITEEAHGEKGAFLLSEQGIEEKVHVVRRQNRPVMPWRASVDLRRACIVTVIAGVGYLLMLAVMTCNVGYFLSVLGGTFLGELVAGRYTQMEEH